MPRTARADTVVADVPHHIVVRGNNRRRIFSHTIDYLYFVRSLARAHAKTPLPLYACCLMSNHVHLLVRPTGADALARFMKTALQRYALFRNARVRGSGRLFEERYSAFPVRTDAHAAIVMAYIELNPVRAGIVVDAAAYRWSSSRIHCLRDASQTDPFCALPWSELPWFRALGADPSARAAAYATFLDECQARDRERFFEAAWGSAAESRRRIGENAVPREGRRPNGSRATMSPK